jgi:hypothetical protein
MEHDNDVRDLAAMFAMCGMLMRGGNTPEEVSVLAYEHADLLMKARNNTIEEGIASIKQKKTA